jgi:hypothetical protein
MQALLKIPFLREIVILTASIGFASCAPQNLINTTPEISEITAILSANLTTPEYHFYSNMAGKIQYSGKCSSLTVDAIAGNNTVTFLPLSVGVYEDCKISVLSALGKESAALHISAFRIGKPLNDTGVSLCMDYAYAPNSGIYNILACDQTSPSVTKISNGVEIANGVDPVPAGQDALYGRDANALTNSSADGAVGFSYKKLGSNGKALINQNTVWNDAGSETDGSQWSCVQDNVTGFMWEIKTNDAGLHGKDWMYTWYNSTGVNDGGEHGLGDTGVATTTGLESSGSAWPGSDDCVNAARCDTEKYVADVNAASLCGANDWRLPTAQELLSLSSEADYTQSLDTHYFPDALSEKWKPPYLTSAPLFWLSATSTPDGLQFYMLTGTGLLAAFDKSQSYSVRLVRDTF